MVNKFNQNAYISNMKSFGVLLRFINYYLKSRKHYSIHSPFIYDFFCNVLISNNQYPEYAVVEQRRKSLRKSKRLISVLDMGAGGGSKSEVFKRIKNIIKRSSCTPSKGQFLFRLSRFLKPRTVIELGTSLGISTMYLSLGAPESEIITIEGCSNLASVADSNFKKAGITNISQNIGEFSKVLPLILGKIDNIDLLFLDGDHREKETIKYFEKCLEYSDNDSVFVIDDINWSKKMVKAWNKIKNYEKVRVSIDLFHFGILFFKEELSKESYILRF